MPKPAPETFSAACMSTSSHSSPVPRTRGATSSTPPAAWSSYSSRCSNPTAGASTTPAADPRGCSCSRSSSFEPRQTATGTAQGAGRHLDLRPGVELHDLAARQDQPGYSRGIAAQIAHGDSFHNDRHPDLTADFILANPPFNVSDWSGEKLVAEQALALRRPPGGQCELRLGAAHGPPPRAKGRSWVRAGQRIDVVGSVWRGRDPAKPHRGGARRLHGSRCRASSSTRRRFPPASGS